MAGPALTALVATRDRPRHLVELLEGLAAQTAPASAFEVVVTDDGSKVPVEGLLPARLLDALSITVVRGESAGPAAARNRALGRVRSPIVLFLNDDTRVAADLVAVHLALHDRTATPTAIMGTFEWIPALARDPFHRAVEVAGLIGTRRMSTGLPLGPECFWTGNLSVPTAEVERAGAFDPRFREPKGEDVDLGHRLADRGVPLYFHRRAVGTHDHPHTLAEWWARAAMIGRGLAALAMKHADPRYVPGGARLFATARDHARAHERVLAQAELAEAWRAALTDLLADPRRAGELRLVGLDPRLTLPADRDRLLVALTGAVSHFDFQRSFWATVRGVGPTG